MLAGGPLRVDLACTVVKTFSAPSHLLDDAPCVPHENVRVVHVVLLVIEDRRCRPDGL